MKLRARVSLVLASPDSGVVIKVEETRCLSTVFQSQGLPATLYKTKPLYRPSHLKSLFTALVTASCSTQENHFIVQLCQSEREEIAFKMSLLCCYERQAAACGPALSEQ